MDESPQMLSAWAEAQHRQCQDGDPAPRCRFAQREGPARLPTAAAPILASTRCSPDMLYFRVWGAFLTSRENRGTAGTWAVAVVGVHGGGEPLSTTAAAAASASPWGAGAAAPTGCRTRVGLGRAMAPASPRRGAAVHGEPAAAQAAR